MENERLAEKALKILRNRSIKAIKLAKKAILHEKIECEEARSALKYYISKWEDTTRPGVLSAACEAVGGNVDEVVPLQVALLFIAATMDIHDDIIDKSISKNAELTVYGKFGGETALLLGNALLVKGLIHLEEVTENLPRERKLLIISTVRDFLLKIIDAHLLELRLRNYKWDVMPEKCLSILERKAVDIEGHMRVGAIFGGGSPKEINALAKYGRILGTLLAIRSEFIDIYEPDELINRIKNEYPPLPILYVLQNRAEKQELKQILLKKNISETDINKILDKIYGVPEISRLLKYLNDKKEEAIKALKDVKKGPAKADLELLVSAMLEDI